MEKQNNARFVRTAVILSLVAAVAIVAGVWAYVQMRPRLTYQAARDAAFAGRYEEMQQALEWLEANAAEDEYEKAVLEFAAMADYNGDYDTALEVLELAGESEQADALRAQCIYHQALKQYESGDYLRAARTAAEVRHYEPAQSLYEMAQAAYQVSLPAPTPTPTPSPEPTQTPAEQTRLTPAPSPTATPSPTPTPAPEIWGEGRIATGFDHTVVLLDDGTVRAFGDNTYGQTDVNGWQNVTAVAAGAYHTIGLTADGRVLSCGDNTHLQCDTSLYAGVQAIAAGDYTTLMLMPTGEVIATGFHSYEFLQELTGAKQIWAGSYGAAVRTPDGLHFSHPGITLEGDVRSMALSRGYAIAADTQGNTLASTSLLPQWQEAAVVSAGESAALALTADGRVLAHAFGRHSRYDFTFVQPVLALSAGTDRCAFVLADGTLEIRHADGSVETYDIK